MTQTEKNTPAYVAYFVPERENPSWMRIGAAWLHKDGEGLALQLDLVPASPGRIVLRTYKPKEQESETEAGA